MISTRKVLQLPQLKQKSLQRGTFRTIVKKERNKGIGNKETRTKAVDYTEQQTSNGEKQGLLWNRRWEYPVVREEVPGSCSSICSCRRWTILFPSSASDCSSPLSPPSCQPQPQRLINPRSLERSCEGGEGGESHSGKLKDLHEFLAESVVVNRYLQRPYTITYNWST